MYRFFALLLATGFALTGAIAVGNHKPELSLEAQMATNGAFRDGLYTGRFAAELERPGAAPIDRWSREQDRESFAAGYLRGYSEYAREAGAR